MMLLKSFMKQNFFDADWNKLGSVEQGWIEETELTTFRDISFSQEVVVDGILTGYVDSGSYETYDDTGSTSKSEFEYNFDDEGNFLSGSEILITSKQLLARIGRYWFNIFFRRIGRLNAIDGS